jgi:hypothetical protein
VENLENETIIAQKTAETVEKALKNTQKSLEMAEKTAENAEKRAEIAENAAKSLKKQVLALEIRSEMENGAKMELERMRNRI